MDLEVWDRYWFLMFNFAKRQCYVMIWVEMICSPLITRPVLNFGFFDQNSLPNKVYPGPWTKYVVKEDLHWESNVKGQDLLDQRVLQKVFQFCTVDWTKVYESVVFFFKSWIYPGVRGPPGTVVDPKSQKWWKVTPKQCESFTKSWSKICGLKGGWREVVALCISGAEATATFWNLDGLGSKPHF